MALRTPVSPCWKRYFLDRSLWLLLKYSMLPHNFPSINLAVAVGRVWVVKLSLYSLDKRRNHERRKNLWPFELWTLIECQGSWNLESWKSGFLEKSADWLSEVCLRAWRTTKTSDLLFDATSNSLQRRRRRNTAAKMQIWWISSLQLLFCCWNLSKSKGEDRLLIIIYWKGRLPTRVCDHFKVSLVRRSSPNVALHRLACKLSSSPSKFRRQNSGSRRKCAYLSCPSWLCRPLHAPFSHSLSTMHERLLFEHPIMETMNSYLWTSLGQTTSVRSPNWTWPLTIPTPATCLMGQWPLPRNVMLVESASSPTLRVEVRSNKHDYLVQAVLESRSS